MATATPQESACSLVEDGTLTLQTEAGCVPYYNGIVVTEDILLVIDYNAWNLQIHRRPDGKLMSSHRLEFIPNGVCLISKTDVAVCLWNSTIVILSFKSIDNIKLVKTLNVKSVFDDCHSVAKLNQDKLIVSGVKNAVFYWCVVNLTDGHVHSTHNVCGGGIGIYLNCSSHIAIKNGTVYISCWTSDSTVVNGVYAYDIYNPHTPKFVYRVDAFRPTSIMVDERNLIYVCDLNSKSIHQLTDSGHLVTTHTLSSFPYRILYDDKHGVLYTTSKDRNVITVYRLQYSHQIDSVIPAEVLKMDSRSLQMYKEALNEGKEKVYNIRVMVVGQYGVGKTTLIQRLLGKHINISERHSTDGIDVHVECSKFSLPAGEWTIQEKDAEKYSRLQRLVKILNERAQKESKSEQEGKSELDGQVTSEELDNGHPHYDLPVSAELNTNQEVELPTSQPVDSPIARVVPEVSSEREAKENKKDTVMEIIQLVNEHSGNLEKSTVEYAALAMWDFAGQYVFYTTHQTFLTSRAIYLLVIDLSQQIKDLIKDDECFLDTEGIKLCKVHDLIEIWMNSIHSCTPSSQPGIPYVILVGTHVDKIPENCRQRVIDEYFVHICEILSNKPAALHLVDCITIDNTQVDPRLEQLKKRIFELAKQQPHWGEEKPARWLPLEQAIMTLKASGVKVAPLSLIEEINRSGSVRIENKDEMDLFLRFQHEMGTILYFSIEGLRKKIVLDPQWLIDAQKSLITAGTFINKTPAIVSKWCEFKKSGKLAHELIDAVWSKEKNPEFHDNKDHILLLMEKLNIIATPRTYDQEGKEVKVENYFLAPCMLSDATPREIISPKPLPEMESSSVLCYVFIEQFLPAPIFHRLVAACVAHWPVAKKNSGNLIYCGCCVFDLDLHHRLTVFSRNHVIFVRVTIMGKTLSFQLCAEVKEFITMTLSKIIGNLEQSLQFELHIQCPKSVGDSVSSLFCVADLQSNEAVPCHSHGDSHVILSSDLLRFWFQEQESSNVASSAGPSQPHPTSDTDRFMSITYLLVDVGSRILRKLLCHHTVTPACTLDQYLANNMNKINSLLKRKVLHQSQMDILFPPSGANTNIEDYDVTLLSALFNNIVPGLNPTEDNMIKSLREDRNILYGHAKSCKMNASEYQTCWSSISSTLITLSQHCGDPSFQNKMVQEIQRTYVSVIPTGFYLDIHKTWFSKIETAEGSLETVKGSLETVQGSLETVQGSLETVQGSLETAGDTIKALKARVEALELKKVDDEN
ncbi:hypothetical protein CHS0354_036252 [Potamilus streckersoni]|uniref:non-specific serine/threonine protein kinase n=1 Tax=Potamilus streckersoni TaxID=2493646 RepID=A0AAE0W2D8_9BIVA|nr:hypothetical protein CHS0354_036252 [Potamilus streckersoni]